MPLTNHADAHVPERGHVRRGDDYVAQPGSDTGWAQRTMYLGMSRMAGGSLVVACAMSHFWSQGKVKGARKGSITVLHLPKDVRPFRSERRDVRPRRRL